jgi:hypothetical protein
MHMAPVTPPQTTNEVRAQLLGAAQDKLINAQEAYMKAAEDLVTIISS